MPQAKHNYLKETLEIILLAGAITACVVDFNKKFAEIGKPYQTKQACPYTKNYK